MKLPDEAAWGYFGKFIAPDEEISTLRALLEEREPYEVLSSLPRGMMWDALDSIRDGLCGESALPRRRLTVALDGRIPGIGADDNHDLLGVQDISASAASEIAIGCGVLRRRRLQEVKVAKEP